ncbi:hypothetical protein F7734_57550 [Scytonema sp. UIC 10036]|uniref:hypothetical protein n=1 Tax=Scytonema sp. UIC 10036 TaxID=2304196 RepID=UPI0012DA12C8|nr:hypothetical protein [Scytonema sp. UIC 10036]MUH01374.1 hypothetical protein [Scytonema sp. UIC 10036]
MSKNVQPSIQQYLTPAHHQFLRFAECHRYVLLHQQKKKLRSQSAWRTQKQSLEFLHLLKQQKVTR